MKNVKQAFYAFARDHTRVRPQHYYALGRRAMVKAVWEVDRRLAEIADTFDFLLQATPVNVEPAWREFRRNLFQVPPVFHYRPLAADPVRLKRRLYEVPIERIEDPTLAHLFRERQDDLDRKITLLTDIGTPRFVLGSLQIYGRIETSLLMLAHELLSTVPPRSRDSGSGGQVDAVELARRATEEIDAYRSRHPSSPPISLTWSTFAGWSRSSNICEAAASWSRSLWARSPWSTSRWCAS